MRNLLILIITIPLMFPVNSQTGTIRFDHFENFPGAPIHTITSLAQDGTGFLWMTTSNDLIRFDGIEFVSFRDRAPELARSLGVIDPLFTDYRGRLWIATRNGVYLYNDTLDRFSHYEVPLTPESTVLSPVVHKIAEDPLSKRIFFLAEDGVIYTFVEDGLKAVLDLPVEGSKFMTIDNKQNIWISGNNIIFRYNIVSNFTTDFNLEEGITNDKEIWDIVVDDSVLYIAALKSEVIRYEPASGKKTKITINTLTPNYYCFLKEDDGYIWIGSAMGLYHYNTTHGTFNVYKSEARNIKSPLSNSVYRIFRDRQGNMWLATDKGLNVSYADQKFEVVGYRFGDLTRGENINSIKRDSRGNLWIGYAIGGIDVFDRDFRLIKSIEKIGDIKPIPEVSQVFDFHEDSDGYMWFGTYMHGLFRYCLSTDEIMQFYPDGNKGSIPGSDIRSISSDREGNLWLAVPGSGVVFYEPEREVFTRLSDIYEDSPHFASIIWPFRILIDARGNLWIGSNQGAIYYDFSSGQTKVYSHDSSENNRITDNNVTQIMEDSRGRVWLGTHNGLNIIEENSVERLTISDGFISDYISGISEDNQGRIWLSTNMGLIRLINPSRGVFEVKNFNKHDGLNIVAFSNNAYFRGKDHLYFGGIDGFVVFNPEEIVENRSPFPLVFTFLQLFNKTIRPGPDNDDNQNGADQVFLDKSLNYLDQITLKERHNMFGISFAALNLTRSVNNQYTYILEGFDKEWIQAGNRKSVSYFNLRPGTYTLKVRASNNDGIWSDETLSLTIKVIPPIWKSRIAVAIYLIVIALIIVLIINFSWERKRIKFQIEQKDILNNLKTQSFINISHELKTPLTLISSPLKNILEKNAGNRTIVIAQEDLKSVYRNVLRLLRIIMQILDFRKIELNKLDFRVSKNDIVPFVGSIINYFDYLAKDKQVDILLNYDRQKDLSFYFDPDKMDKIIYNVLSNALKHSPPGSAVYINITITAGSKKGHTPGRNNPCIKIDVDDCGTGIDKNRLGKIFEQFSNSRLLSSFESGSTGVGLSIVREFTELHKGTVEIFSPYHDAEGRLISGTRVTLLFPSYDAFPGKEYITDDNCRYNEIILENSLTVVDKFPDDDENDADYYENLSHGYKILIIEDDPELRDMLKKEIGQFHVALQARDGETGVKIARETIPDLIVSDVLMPGIDGYQVVSTLKHSPETSHIPIILLTAKSLQENEIQAYTIGADAFVKKPFHTKTLLHLIDSLIENRLKLRMKFFSNFGLNKAVPSATDEVFFDKLLKLINDNISDPGLGVNLLTRELHMSRAQLYKKVNAVTNTSVKLFIRKIRLRKAAEILKSEKIPVTEVAYAVGFDSLPYFSKCFQDEFGVSPSKYALSSSN